MKDYRDDHTWLMLGDCIDRMKEIPDGSVDLVLTDPPYGSTQNKWDSIIPLDKMWESLRNVTSEVGLCILHGYGVFSAKLILSNESMYRYSIIWQKTTPTGHLNANRMPLRSHEDILIFYDKLPTYNPIKTYGHVRKVSTSKHKRNSKVTTNYGDHGLTTYDSTERFPRSVVTFKTDKQRLAVHPTQKPVALIEYLIKTYTNTGDTVLDFTMGSGTTGVACRNLGRKFIGIELDDEYFKIAKDRILDYEDS